MGDQIPINSPTIVSSIDQLDLDMTKVYKVASWLLNVGVMIEDLLMSGIAVKNFNQADDLMNLLKEENIAYNYQELSDPLPIAQYSTILAIIGQNFLDTFAEFKRCDHASALSILNEQFSDSRTSTWEWIKIIGTVLTVGAGIATGVGFFVESGALMAFGGGVAIAGGIVGITTSSKDLYDGKISLSRFLVETTLNSIGLVAGGVAAKGALTTSEAFAAKAVISEETAASFEELTKITSLSIATKAGDTVAISQNTQLVIENLVKKDGFTYERAEQLVNEYIQKLTGTITQYDQYKIQVKNTGKGAQDLKRLPRESDEQYNLRRLKEWLYKNGGLYWQPADGSSGSSLDMPPDIQTIFNDSRTKYGTFIHDDYDHDGIFDDYDTDLDNDGVPNEKDANPYNPFVQ